MTAESDLIKRINERLAGSAYTLDDPIIFDGGNPHYVPKWIIELRIHAHYERQLILGKGDTQKAALEAAYADLDRFLTSVETNAAS